jgi:hypothetical protein
MKTCALYGFISALAGAFLTLIQYFAGLHSDISKLGMANAIGGIGGLAIAITFTALVVKARRAEVPPGEGFGYGSALWAGTLMNIFAGILTAVFAYAYHAFINPGFADILFQDNANKLEARGLSGSQLDRIESINRTVFSPVPLALITLVYVVIAGFIISLIVAAILKRPAMEPSVPPPL